MWIGKSLEGSYVGKTMLSRIEMAMQADRHRLRRSYQRALQLPEDSPRRAGDLQRIELALEQSITRRDARLAASPHIEFDPELPITDHRSAIIDLIQTRQTIVVCGATGSGKSTQLPKLCLEAGRGREAMIGHTQPRRLAARAIATRLAEEMETKIGELVGFKIRFTDHTQPSTLVKLMTDGVLLAEIQRDRFLDAYDTIIIDEAHERSLNIDLLMAYLHRLLAKRPDLKLIITSATIDAERFSEHFADRNGPAPIVLVEGRTYPVDIRYRGAEDAFDSDDSDLASRMVEALDELSSDGNGDVLVFMPSERDIRDAAKHLRGYLTSRGSLDRTEILPLYSRLTEAEQQKIFQSHSKRRIVLATNVAESSLTVPGIKYVIDTGTARISRYAPRSKVQRLPIEPIAQASADQRAGRCGRTSPGICIRLFSESDYAGRSRFTTPEIRRTNLASAILHAKLLGVGDLEELPLLDPPRPEMIRDGMATLRELKALDSQDQLTDIGKKLGRWPIDPRVGRMLIEADRNGCLSDMLIIASALEVQDPRLRPPEKQQAADLAHQKFTDPHSDFLSFLKIWDFYHRLKEELGRSRLEKACRENFLSLVRLREWADVHRQLLELVGQQGIKPGKRSCNPPLQSPVAEEPKKNNRDDITSREKSFPTGYNNIHLSLLVGLLSGVAMLDEERQYKGAGGIDFQIWPGSGLRQVRPKWIVAAEVVETHQRYGRTVAAIQPEWIEPLAAHLLKSSYDQPHFSRKNGSGMVHRRATLFGLPVVERRQVALAPIDPELARKLLIEEGLVERQLVSRATFYQQNCKLLDEVHEWAHRTRRRDLVMDSFKLQQFYETNLPAEVVDRGTLEKWDKTLSKDAPVRMTWEGIVEGLDPNDAKSLFPDHLKIGESRLPISYRFEPGGERDGVSIQVPEMAVQQLDAATLDWLVPGLIEEKVLGLIKSLPKSLRRNLAPAADTASKVVKQFRENGAMEREFWPELCTALSKIAGEPITTADFPSDRIPEHLRMRVEVVDDKGKAIEASRDLATLKSVQPQSQKAIQATVQAITGDWQRTDMQTFDIENLPESLQVKKGNILVTVYPTLVEVARADTKNKNQESPTIVRTEIVDRIDQAKRSLRNSLIRLYSTVERRELRSQVVHLPKFAECQLWMASRFGSDRLRDGLCDLMARIAFVEKEGELWTKDDFELRRVDRIRRISIAAQEIAKWLPKFAESLHQTSLLLEKSPATWRENVQSIRGQLDALFQSGFFVHVPWEWLQEYGRYIQGIRSRLDRLKTIGPAKDMELERQVQAVQKDFQDRLSALGHEWPEGKLLEYRWMIEEFRVSLFAQQLGTRFSVSPKRLEKLASELSS